MVSGLIFKSVIHFDFIFVCAIKKKVTQFYSFACNCSVFLTAFIEVTAFPLLHILGSFVVN